VSTPLRYPRVTLADWAGNVVDDDGTQWLVTDWDGWDPAPEFRGSTDPRRFGAELGRS
jgi:hypothetical protein